MLKHINDTNSKVATKFGTIHFNEKGESTDLTETQEKVLAIIPPYKFVGAKKQAPKDEKKQVEELHEDKPKVAEKAILDEPKVPKKKAPAKVAKKATAKKKAAK